MMKRFLTLIAIMAISLVTACAQTPTNCKYCPIGADCCGACPCGEASASEDTTGKMCDPAKKKHHHHHHKASAAKAAAATPTLPNKEDGKSLSVIEGVKKMINGADTKDAKKPQ